MFSIKVEFFTLFPLSAVALAKEENLLLVFIFLPGKKINTLKILENISKQKFPYCLKDNCIIQNLQYIKIIQSGKKLI